jgi:hypothetical protein
VQTDASKERRGRSSAAADIVLNVPAQLKHLVAPIEKLIDTVGKRVDQLDRDGRAVDYAAIERLFGELVGDIETAAHRCTLEATDIEAKSIEVRGEAYCTLVLAKEWAPTTR